MSGKRQQVSTGDVIFGEGRNSTHTIEIVDAQFHANRYGIDWERAPMDITLARVIGGMDALGITAAVIDEFTAIDPIGRMLPGEVESDGFWRPRRPFSRHAVEAHPERFRYLGRIDRADLRMPALMAGLRRQPGAPAALRLQWGPDRVVWSDPEFSAGGYASFFALAEKHQIPIFLVIAPRADLVAQYARMFPGCQFVLDHLGVVSGVERPAPSVGIYERLKRFDNVVELAQFPNVAVKWCHPERLASQAYPFDDLVPGLRRLIDAYGADRIMWAGDTTEGQKLDKTDYPVTWSQSLHHVLDADFLTPDEKAWILGKSVRRLLKWEVGT